MNDTKQQSTKDDRKGQQGQPNHDPKKLDDPKHQNDPKQQQGQHDKEKQHNR
jgi:hypothetical protein